MWETEEREREGDEKKRQMGEEEEEERGSNEGPVGNQEKWVGGRVKEALRRLQERQVDEYLLQSGCQTKMEIESSTQQLRSK